MAKQPMRPLSATPAETCQPMVGILSNISPDYVGHGLQPTSAECSDDGQSEILPQSVISIRLLIP